MANRVRFLSLTLAGFGRYDRPTKFNLSGRSCSFTAPNELGKSTFQAGLLSTLFGPPSVRAKAAAFQSRFRSWHGPIAFSGELEFTVNDEGWRIRQDFDTLETRVWRLSSLDAPELRLHVKGKSGRSTSDTEQYSQFLEDWLGLANVAVYEAMFTISQESILSTSWQIDPRIASLVYGPSVERLERNLHGLFDRFREITRNTRDFQIAVGSQGERNGRSDGRLDQITARIEERRAKLESAQNLAATVTQYRTQLSELDLQCDNLRLRVAETTRSLDDWQSWVELESRLRPAVESYESLRASNERCQEVARPLAEVRSKLSREYAIFDQAPPNLSEQIEYYPLVMQAVDEARARYSAAAEQSARIHDEWAQAQHSLENEFQSVRGRSSLPDDVEELRLIRNELEFVEKRLIELGEGGHTQSDQHSSHRARLDELSSWHAVAQGGEAVLRDARSWIDAFQQRHAEYLTMQAVLASETAWLGEQEGRIARLEQEYQKLLHTRQQEESAIQETVREARQAAERIRTSRRQFEQQQHELQQRYVDFQGAPADLMALWDRNRELETQASTLRQSIDQFQSRVRMLEQRVLWRRVLTATGSILALLAVVFDPNIVGGTVALTAIAVCIALRWLYAVHGSEASECKRTAQRLDAELLRVTRQRDQMAAQLGPRFVVPPEREAEWRRLWPTYQRELDCLNELFQSVSSAESDAEYWMKRGDEAQDQLALHTKETEALAEEARFAIQCARAERLRRHHELERVQECVRQHVHYYFAGDEAWPLRPRTAPIPHWPVTVMALADAALSTLNSAQELVDWLMVLDDSAWTRFGLICDEVRQLQALLAPDPEEAALREQSLMEARELRQSLQFQESRTADAIAPFTAETDPTWLRARCAVCAELERRIADLESALEGLPDTETRNAELQTAEAEWQDARVRLLPLLDPFDGDLERLAAAYDERNQLIEQARVLEKQAAEVLEESGFASLEQLAHEAGKAEGLVGTIRAESRELLERAPDLWQAVDAPSELAGQRVTQLQIELQDQRRSLEHAERDRAELAATIRQIEADPAHDTAVIQSDLEKLTREQEDLTKQRDLIAAEFQETNRLMLELKRVERTALEGRITAYFADFSRTSGRRVELDDELHIFVRHEDGTRYSPTQLSHGARDQLYLAVYLATTAGFDLPFILDDPFVNCDDERLAAIRACWDRLIPDHQLILLSHDPQLAAWAPTLEMRQAA